MPDAERAQDLGRVVNGRTKQAYRSTSGTRCSRDIYGRMPKLQKRSRSASPTAERELST
jgi:hypothetical protein